MKPPPPSPPRRANRNATTMKWWQRALHRATGHAKGLRERVHRVSEQAIETAYKAGRVTAAKVIALQKAAFFSNPMSRRTVHKLDRVMERSARAVEQRVMVREPDRYWQAGYSTTADRRLPSRRFVFDEPEAPEEEPPEATINAAPPPPRPAWPGPRPELDEPEPGE